LSGGRIDQKKPEDKHITSSFFKEKLAENGKLKKFCSSRTIPSDIKTL
jgi:hypothetical protein